MRTMRDPSLPDPRWLWRLVDPGAQSGRWHPNLTRACSCEPAWKVQDGDEGTGHGAGGCHHGGGMVMLLADTSSRTNAG
ncbi:MAG: hypothetical protein C4345_03445 [Chloroflexota bacterium]